MNFTQYSSTFLQHEVQGPVVQLVAGPTGDFRFMGREFDPCPVPYFRGD